ncbi:DUF4405 domain-containing protein [Thermococcus paralvinellae]|uniref:Flavinylation-associated cytochrome domain-containing protein n=1 Tax=Thermococcus paralvinellae TaxID=582419 RepID=W0I4X9_9EURY|nr:DUF4405 domain-containing protein [Thermococcus paralvinellae]AHF79485.1 Hypothetical protein TES1_0088 [Thermococcus paralvinellae]
MSFKLRMWVSLTLFVLWLITGITGIFLLIGPLFAKWGISLPISLMDTIHIYVGFAFFGLSVVHVALNWSAMKNYFRKLMQ